MKVLSLKHQYNKVMNNFSKYTYMGFHLNGLVDSGERVTIEEVKEQIKAGALLQWLEETYEGRAGNSVFSEEKDKEEVNELFKFLAEGVDEGRKFAVKTDGLCLLVAYCFEAAQQKHEEATKKIEAGFTQSSYHLVVDQ